MQRQRRFVLPAALVLALTGGAVAWRSVAQEGATPPAHAQAPTASLDVVYARAFRLAAPYHHTWRADGADVLTGTLLIVDLDPELVLPMDGLQPVLYVGDQVAERVNHGYPSGRVVTIVPDSAQDWSSAPIFMGTPELPERVDAARIADERALAVAAGIRAPLATRVDQARRAGGEPLRLADRSALEREAARLVIEYVPDEAEWAQSLLAPVVR